MKSDKMVEGWMVSEADEGRGAKPVYFLDVNNAIAHRQQQENRNVLIVQLQMIRPDWAADLHGSRLRRTERNAER